MTVGEAFSTFTGMEQNSIYASRSTLVLTQASEYAAGMRTGTVTFRLEFAGTDGIEARMDGDADFAEGVDPREFAEAMSDAVKRYALDSVRLSYLGRPGCLLEKNSKYVVGNVYRAVFWVDLTESGYGFGFMPERNVPRSGMEPGAIPAGAMRYTWKASNA